MWEPPAEAAFHGKVVHCAKWAHPDDDSLDRPTFLTISRDDSGYLGSGRSSAAYQQNVGTSEHVVAHQTTRNVVATTFGEGSLSPFVHVSTT